MVTLDKSWFYLLYSHVWFGPGEEPPARPEHTLENRNVIVTIRFSAANFHVMLALPKSQKFNATYYTNVILWRVLDSSLKADGRQFIIHANRARFKRAKIYLKRISSNTLHIHPIHRIWHSAISIFSGILNYG
jgi:hypothetical protein